MENFTKLISYLMHSRTQAHVYHLQTPSFAAHMALNTYYTGIVDIIDGLVESYQGKYGILTGYSSPPLMEYQSCEAIQAYFKALSITISQCRQDIPDSYIQNQIDTVEELIVSTLYKLKFLQ
jgi:hypothetical protein